LFLPLGKERRRLKGKVLEKAGFQFLKEKNEEEKKYMNRGHKSQEELNSYICLVCI
jgi:hypothetical protein